MTGQEWLELGRPRPRRWLRPAAIVTAAVLVLTMLVAAVVVGRPYWLARHRELEPAAVRSAVVGLGLADATLRWIRATPYAPGSDRCAVLGGPQEVTEATGGASSGVPAVEASGRPGAGESQLTVTTLVFPDPTTAARVYELFAAAVADESCRRHRELGTVGVDLPPLPDRQLGYQVAFGAGGMSSGESWWYRVRMLRYGNTVTRVSAFGPAGAADVAADAADALDRLLAEA